MERKLMNWDPWSDLNRMERDLSRWFGGPSRAGNAEFPPVNIWTNEDEAVLLAELPGIDPDRLDIAVKDETVTVRGERPASDLKEGESYVRRERSAGSFARTFALPFKLDPEKVGAEYHRGVLEIHLPRSAADKPKKITVTTK